jgi:hypothetical protein
MKGDAFDIFVAAYGGDPESFRSDVHRTLQLAGLYMLGFQLVEQAVVGGVEGFFLLELNPDNASYKRLIAEKGGKGTNKKYRAGLAFILDSGGITEAESAELVELLDHRNDIGHRMPRIIFGALDTHDERLQLDMGKLHKVPMYLAKLSNFWANIDVDIGVDIGDEPPSEEARQGAIAAAALIFGALYYRLTGKMPDVPSFWNGAITGWGGADWGESEPNVEKVPP